MYRRGTKVPRQNKTRGNIEFMELIQESLPETNTRLSFVSLFNQRGENGRVHNWSSEDGKIVLSRFTQSEVGKKLRCQPRIYKTKFQQDQLSEKITHLPRSDCVERQPFMV